MHSLTLSVATALLAASSVDGAFDGPYAPELWTFSTDAGGFVKSHTSGALILVGGDIKFGGDAGNTDLTILAAASGTWSFNWEFEGEPSPGFDNAYYLVNGVPHFLAGDWFASGSVSISIDARDVIGFRVDSVDGIFGPGTLTITNFSAPVPGPGAIAVFLPLLLAACRRSRAPVHSRSTP